MLSLQLHEGRVYAKDMKWDAPDLDQDVAAEVGGSGNPTTNWALGQDEQGIPDAAPYGFHLVQIDVLRGYLKASVGSTPLTKRGHQHKRRTTTSASSTTLCFCVSFAGTTSCRIYLLSTFAKAR